jgi:hypothetical protein
VALTTLEAEEWYAEQNGLIDALIERDCTHQYQGRSALEERYSTGLKDGRVLIQVAKKNSLAAIAEHGPTGWPSSGRVGDGWCMA